MNTRRRGRINQFSHVLTLLPLLLTLFSLQPIDSADALRHIVINKYSMNSLFVNTPIQIGNRTVLVNGSIKGIYLAKLFLYSGRTVVEVKFVNYTIDGFGDEEVVNTVKSILERGERHVVEHSYPPYRCMLTNESPWVTPYHYPPNLLIQHGADPRGEFVFECVYQEGLSREKHYYRHDLNTGILVELRVSIIFRLVERNVTGYRLFTATIIGSNTPSILINREVWVVDERYFATLAFAPLFIALISRIKRHRA